MTNSSSTTGSSAGSRSGKIRREATFVTTRWSVVLAAGGDDTAHARDALARLCQAYWYPLYAYVRQRGYSPHDAQDLTQEFFRRLLEKNTLGGVVRERGRFRSFLLATMNHFLADEWRRARAQKRGGGNIVSLDARQAETRFGGEPVDSLTPEKLFEQNWALAVLDAVYEQLRREHEAAGKAALFDTLKFCLTGARSALPYAELATRLNMPESTLKVTVHRLRQRYRELLRAEVAHTVAAPDEIEEELNCLLRALTS